MAFKNHGSDKAIELRNTSIWAVHAYSECTDTAWYYYAILLSRLMETKQ